MPETTFPQLRTILEALLHRKLKVDEADRSRAVLNVMMRC